MSAGNQIVVSGAREHNLKDISLELPRDALVVITGLSGSGKSSLAFDTIYAEGQRRYVESLSAYARQFLGQMDKPDVDSIEGLSPAISIDQKTTSRNPRSTVGTVTEIYDYLRLLWARVGKPHCPICGRPIVGQSAEQIIDQVMELAEGTRFMVLAPIVRGRKGEYGKLLEELRAEGFARVKIDDRSPPARRVDRARQELQARHLGRRRPAGDAPRPAQAAGRLDRDGGRPRRRAGRDRDRRRRPRRQPRRSSTRREPRARERRQAQIVPGAAPEPGTLFTFSEHFACPEHGPSLVELEPRIFSFNSPHGACERCTGLGSQMEIDPELVVPDPTLSIGEGAIAPWADSASNYYEQLTEAIAERYDVDLDAPWEDLAEEQRDLFLYGTDGEPLQVTYRNRFGRRRSYATRFEGIVPNLERRYRETDSEWTREKIEEYMSLRPCPDCDGARLRPESRAVLVGGTRIEEFCALSARRALEWLEELELSETDRHVARLILREIEERLRFLENVGIGYLSMERAAATLSGGEAQRIRLATQIGSSLVGVLYILDEPSIGLHQRDNAKLIGDARAAARPRQHRDRRRARRADDARRRPPRRHRARARASTAAGSSRRAPPRRSQRVEESLTGQFLAGTRRDRGAARAGARRAATSRSSARSQHNLARHRRADPARRADLRHRRLGLGQVDARQRRPVQGGRQPPAPARASAPARTARSTASSSSTRSSPSTSRRSGARRARTRRPTPACST